MTSDTTAMPGADSQDQPIRRIAGHAFVESWFGRVCRGCGRRYIDISGCTGPEHLNKPGIAHQGALSSSEQAEIQAENDRIYAAAREVASGGGATPTPEQV